MRSQSRDLVASIKKYRNILIVVKGSPDPDAIASSYAISVICHLVNVSCTISATKIISLPPNRALIDILGIPLRVSPVMPDAAQFDAYIVTDHQSPNAPELNSPLPCAAYIDHHEPGEEKIVADFILKNTEAGSTSTLMALILKELDIGLDPATMRSVSTALLYGIYTDTDKYSQAGKLDYEALDYLVRFSDHDAFNKISRTPLSQETIRLLKIAIEGKIPYKDWLIVGIGYVEASRRDSIAIIADFLLKREKFTTVIVYAAIENRDHHDLTLDASLRTTSENMDLNGIIKKITPGGGGRKFKGAYQIDMNYFSHCPDRTLLWNMIHLTTVGLLKKTRDELIITELKGFYQKFRKKVRDYLPI
ncbi:MAG: DHH family phosphoesterase [Spirochaetes bacterium]|nr:DHH family phosphoesterase [Spirochaetota bacterium]